MSLGMSNTLYGWYMLSVVPQLYWFSTEMVVWFCRLSCSHQLPWCWRTSFWKKTTTQLQLISSLYNGSQCFCVCVKYQTIARIMCIWNLLMTQLVSFMKCVTIYLVICPGLIYKEKKYNLWPLWLLTITVWFRQARTSAHLNLRAEVCQGNFRC
jgi:hypothetical protein